MCSGGQGRARWCWGGVCPGGACVQTGLGSQWWRERVVPEGGAVGRGRGWGERELCSPQGVTGCWLWWPSLARRCGVVRCGVVWCGVVWCGVVWCGPGPGPSRSRAPTPPALNRSLHPGSHYWTPCGNPEATGG
uniref:Bm11596 n=1 Tax=Brugia malayi TaxID=6279 RepID=A0A1I9GDT4_BRUMA|nr:Bm11596 [Brugia malayi]